MRFKVPCTNRLQLSLAAAHGAVDAAKPPELLAVYALALLPVPGPLCTAGFALSSVVHFASDIGLWGSIVLHLVLSITAAVSYKEAVSMLLNYMCYLHIPLLVVKLIFSGSFSPLFIMLYCMIFFAKRGIPRTDDAGQYVFGHKHQLIVVCHVLISQLL